MGRRCRFNLGKELLLQLHIFQRGFDHDVSIAHSGGQIFAYSNALYSAKFGGKAIMSALTNSTIG